MNLKTGHLGGLEMAGHLKGISSMATRQILADLAGLYQQQSGCLVTIESMGGVNAARSVREGRDVDIVILASHAMQRLEIEGHVVAGTRMDFARSDIAIAVRAGARQPAIHDEVAVKKAILDGGKFCFSTGPSGDHLKLLLERWIAPASTLEQAVQAPSGVPVGEMLARGEAELGFQQLSELLNFPGVDVVGILPPEIQATTIFSVGISTASAEAESAHHFIRFLVSPAADAAKQRHGMLP